MGTTTRERVKTVIHPDEHDRMVRRLRRAAAGRGQTEHRRQWIRAATRC